MKKILVAIAALSGGIMVNKEIVGFEVHPGEELSTEKIKKLGLSEDHLKLLQESGAIGEVEVREAEADAAVDDAALKAAVARAEKAESEVKVLTETVAGLEKDLADATKPKSAAA